MLYIGDYVSRSSEALWTISTEITTGKQQKNNEIIRERQERNKRRGRGRDTRERETKKERERTATSQTIYNALYTVTKLIH